MSTCVCCGEHYFDRGKDSLCDKCDDSGIRQSEYSFTGELIEHPFCEFKPTKKYLSLKFHKEKE